MPTLAPRRSIAEILAPRMDPVQHQNGGDQRSMQHDGESKRAALGSGLAAASADRLRPWVIADSRGFVTMRIWYLPFDNSAITWAKVSHESPRRG